MCAYDARPLLLGLRDCANWALLSIGNLPEVGKKPTKNKRGEGGVSQAVMLQPKLDTGGLMVLILNR